MMKTTTLPLLLLLAISLVAPANAASTIQLLTDITPAEGTAFPDFSATTATGDVINTADIEGAFAMSFWATWCGPCRKEMPELQRVATDYVDQVTIIGVSIDASSDGPAITEFTAENNITFPIVHDAEQVLGDLFSVKGIPTLVYVNAEHKIEKIKVGFSSPKGEFWDDFPAKSTGETDDATTPAPAKDVPDVAVQNEDEPPATIAPSLITLDGTENLVEGEKMVNFAATTLTGDPINTAEIEGPFVVTFFATWCGPCRREMPELVKIHEQYGDEVTIIAVSVDAPKSSGALPRFVEEYDLPFPVVLAGLGDMASQFEIKYIPTLVYVDAEDTIVSRVNGFNQETPFWQAYPVAADEVDEEMAAE